MKQNIDSAPEAAQRPSHLGDARTGQRFRIHAITLFLVITSGVAFVLFRNQRGPGSTATVAPVLKMSTDTVVPQVRFTDITSAAGIAFTHHNGAAGDKLLPETMGGGVGFFDFDNDGDQDLLLVNSTDWPAKVPGGRRATCSALYENDGHGSFRDVTAGSGLDVAIYGMAPAFGDFDDDGWVDIFVTAVGRNHLFKNLGNGKFSDVTSPAGVEGSPNEWSTCATWFDSDNDGDLDLFVGNYVRWSPEIDLQVGLKHPGIGRLYGQPRDFEGTFPYLYRNEGNGKFRDVSAGAGVQIRSAAGAPLAKSLGVISADVNADGWTDLVVANDTVQNLLFVNQKDGTFKELGGRSGIAFDSFGGTRGAMGIDVARYREDESLGVLIGNFANEMTALYVAQPGNVILFSDEAQAEGIGTPSRALLTFGVFFFDSDLDGRLDILSVNGHLDEEVGKVFKGQQYLQPAQLFWNAGPGPGGKGTFVIADASRAGPDLFKPMAGRGSAYADIDGDGDLDLIVTQTGGAPMLLRNDQELGNNFIRLKLLGKGRNRNAIGAWVRVRANGREHWRAVSPTRSYLSQSELPVTIGLGKESRIERAEVRWPNGRVQQFEPRLNQEIVVREL